MTVDIRIKQPSTNPWRAENLIAACRLHTLFYLMPKKKGPPYTDIPECKYVVVVHPWGMLDAGKRSQKDHDRLGFWIRSMLRGQRRGVRAEDELQVEVTYTRNTVSQPVLNHP